jgi:hypothetical protein
MTAFRRNLAARVLIALASAAYAIVGIGGYGLHSLLPCADGSCRESHAAAGCSCGHEHCRAATLLARQADNDRPSISPAGHDAENCALCALLAQVRAGQATISADHFFTASVYAASDHPTDLLPADIALAFAARGPPAC